MQPELYNGDRSTANHAVRATDAGGHDAARHTPKGQVVILTGAAGSGKTTVCDRTAAAAGLRGYSVGGILTRPRVTVEGTRGLDVEDVRCRERVPLAELTGPATGPVIGRWRFHRRGLDWGDAVLASALPSDLLVVDEVGPLELERDEGWANAVTTVQDGRFRLALVVVRPALVPSFLDRVTGMAVTTLAVTPEDRDRLPAELVARLDSGS